MTKEDVIAKYGQFFSDYGNTYVEKEDITAKDQCFDLAFAWVDALGLDRATIRHALAYQIYESPIDLTIQFFDLIPNTPSAVPQCGDIVVWNKNYNGGAGHVGIATGAGNTEEFYCFAQNDPTGTNAHVKSYNYAYVDGWLRPKTQIVSSQPGITDQTMLPFGGDIGTIEFQAARSLISDLKRDNGVFTNNIKAIEANVTTLASENANLKTDLAEAQQKLLDAQNTPNPTPTTQSLAQYTAGDLLKELLNRLRPS